MTSLMDAPTALHRLRSDRRWQRLVLLAFCLVTLSACLSAWLRPVPDFNLCSASSRLALLSQHGSADGLHCPACLPLQAPPPRVTLAIGTAPAPSAPIVHPVHSFLPAHPGLMPPVRGPPLV